MATVQLYGQQTLNLGQPGAELDVTDVEKQAFVARQFPPGAYFDRGAGWLPRVARGIARVVSRFRKRKAALERNMDPRYADELLDEWESAYGISPDEDATLGDRRDAVLTKVRSIGGNVAEYYQQLAVSFGYTDAVVTDAADPFTTLSACDDSLLGGEWKLTFTVTAASQGADRDALLEQLIDSQLLAGWNTHYELS